MNDSDLEDQLRAFTPAAPSADLAGRIERELAATPASAPTSGVLVRPKRQGFALGWLRDLGWAGAGAVAMLAGVMFFATAHKTPSSPTATAPSAVTTATDEAITVSPAPVAVAEAQAFEPAETSRELIAVNDSNELLETADGPVREVRYTYMERLAWAHPGTGARLEIEVPREDVYLMPVSLQ